MLPMITYNFRVGIEHMEKMIYINKERHLLKSVLPLHTTDSLLASHNETSELLHDSFAFLEHYKKKSI